MSGPPNPRLTINKILDRLLWYFACEFLVRLPSHKDTAERVQDCIDGAPCEQHTKVEADVTVCVKQEGPSGFDNVIERPGVAEAEEAGRQRDGVDGCCDVGYYPEYQPTVFVTFVSWWHRNAVCGKKGV